MKNVIFFSMAAFAVMTIVSCKKKDDNQDNTVSKTDKTFVTMASMSNYAEISAGQMAADKAQDSSIASFGRMMVSDHTTAGQKLTAIANTLGLQTTDSLDAAHMALKDSLTTLMGSAFDSVYIRSQVADHQKAIDVFQAEADGGSQKDLRGFANSTLPLLHMHLQMADSLAAAH